MSGIPWNKQPPVACACACHTTVEIDQAGKSKLHVPRQLATLTDDLECMVACVKCGQHHDAAMMRRFGDRTEALRSRPWRGEWPERAGDDQC